MRTRIFKNLFFMWKLFKYSMYQLEQTMNFSFNLSSVKVGLNVEFISQGEFF